MWALSTLNVFSYILCVSVFPYTLTLTYVRETREGTTSVRTCGSASPRSSAQPPALGHEEAELWSAGDIRGTRALSRLHLPSPAKLTKLAQIIVGTCFHAAGLSSPRAHVGNEGPLMCMTVPALGAGAEGSAWDPRATCPLPACPGRRASSPLQPDGATVAHGPGSAEAGAGWSPPPGKSGAAPRSPALSI